MKFLNKNRGITLIALVITIIILLILAGITIASLSGENGILKMATEAVEATKQAEAEEQRQLTIAEARMNLNGTKYKSTYKGEEVTVPIPAGFAVSQVDGENTVDDGLVIIDSKGNEFVWIPCEYTQEEATKNNNANAVLYNTDDNQGDNRDTAWKGKQWYYNGGEWYDSQPKTVGEYSIKAHHGFYVARYEAGVPEDAPFYASEEGDPYYDADGKVQDETEEKDNTKAKNTSEYIPVSKKGNQVWTFISQTNAKTVAEKMVINNPDVESYLIDSHAWNTICRLIAKKYNGKDVDSTKWGNYWDNTTTKYEKLKGLWAKHLKENSWTVAKKYGAGKIPSGISPQGQGNGVLELATGICEDFKVYNIYDLAGNVAEWTTETGKSPSDNDYNGGGICSEEICPMGLTGAVRRGGSYNDRGESGPVTVANGFDSTSVTSVDIGFRPVLYLK